MTITRGIQRPSSSPTKCRSFERLDIVGINRFATTALFVSLVALMSVSAVLAQESTNLWQVYLDAALKARTENNLPDYEKFLKLAESQAKADGGDDDRFLRTECFLNAFYIENKRYAEADEANKSVLASLEKGAGANSLTIANLLRQLGEMYNDRNRYPEAEPLFRRAVELYRSNMKPGDSTLATTYLTSLGGNLFQQRKLVEANGTFSEALAIINKDPALKDSEFESYTLGYLGLIANTESRYSDAERYLRNAIDVMVKLHGENHPKTSDLLLGLAIVFDGQSKYAESATAYSRAIKIDEAIYGASSIQVENALSLEASGLRQQRNYAGAIPLLERARIILEDGTAGTEKQIAEVESDLANALARKTEYGKAAAACERMKSVFAKRSLIDDEYRLFVNHCNQEVYFLAGNYWAESQIYLDSIAIYQKLGHSRDEDRADDLLSLASDYRRLHKFDDELETLRQLEKFLDDNPTFPRDGYDFEMYNYYFSLGQFEAAAPYLSKAIELVSGKSDKIVQSAAVRYRIFQGLLTIAKGDRTAGEKLYQDSIKALGDFNWIDRDDAISDVAYRLAMILSNQKDFAGSEPYFEQSIELREKASGPNHPTLAAALDDYAKVLRKLRRESEAVPLETRAKAIRAMQPLVGPAAPPDSPENRAKKK